MAEKNEKWTMTNGNHRTRGWTEDENGNWVPSLHDRRRVTTAGLEMYAENHGGMIHGPVVYKIIQMNSTDKADHHKLSKMVLAQLQQG
jgi:hypothetical protein